MNADVAVRGGHGQRAAPTHPRAQNWDSSRHRLGDPNWAGTRSTQLGALAGTWRFQANHGRAIVEPMAARKSCATAAVLLVIGVEAADQADGGGAMDPFRLGGACARELSPWVSFGHGILRRGAPGKGKPRGARWVFVCPHSVRPPCFPCGVGFPRSGLSVPERRGGPRLLCPLARRPAASRRGLWPSNFDSQAVRPPGHRFVPDFARRCSPPGPPPLTLSLGLESHSCLFPEGRRELGRFISAPCHLSQACWELPPRPKATSREWVVSVRKGVCCLTGCRKVGNRTKNTMSLF